MRKIWEFIVSIPADKWMHFCAGAGIDLFSFVILYRFVPCWLAFVLSIILALVALFGKEIYDYHHSQEGHSVEVMDIVAGMIGVALVNIALLIMLL